ncbi:ATP-binding protein [Marinobacter sp. M3C]|jgi:two-component system OmpR family sensor kinase|uniref:ATP-binding protein n=1 Tax=unclassified Marinobacter TaxID=83889 RepID=UPI00200EFFDA|nr:MULTISPECIES: ATP-binding protein [unclassified Marinobacter]MCL1476321.1 ATP-binding protein [Marinobacter sp.]MCL1479975.1 ATP-binding protein [Marinobacter sp.]MCL1483078.1 ATP-binding protein [Marinobacter sp.]UQG58033.1 ATP-binding protein [Marinobacter sp. M4C]UQG60673.1 ATP-binding protein [Marinobacter sp. M3C]
MSTKASLHKTLGTWLTLGVTLLWLLGVIASGVVARHEMNEVFDSALEETAQRILPLAVTDILNREGDPSLERALALKEHNEYLTYLVRDKSGKLLLQSHDADPKIFGSIPREGFSDTLTHRIYGESAISETLYIEVAEPLDHRREAVLDTSLALLLPLIFLIPISLVGVWWVIKRSLRRVVVLQQSIEVRGGGDLSPVVVGRLPEEFEPIMISVNRLLERLRRALEAERSFTANSAHELRTPLATALAKLQRLKTETQNAGVKARASEIEESLRTLSKLSEKLLELAKAEGGSALSEQANNLVPILRMVASDYDHQAPGRLLLNLPDDDVTSLLDLDAFAILVRNLIENALRHGADDQPVNISLTDDGILRVVNRGEVVSPEKLALLRNRFVRSNTNAVGSGIGLAIVEAIASGAGITLNLRSPASGQSDGFEAELNIVVVK